jgi:hypothetical protein
MFASDGTCCVCRERGLAVQLHHIDDDPANHDPANLAVLCLQDHNRTQLRGGFGKKLLAADVRTYRDDWVERVRARRDRADDLAAEAMAKVSAAAPADDHDTFVMPPAAFISSLPAIRSEALMRGLKRGGFGSTANNLQRQYDYIEELLAMLTSLAGFFPANHFDGKPARKYFSEVVRSRFIWHRAHAEPDGPGTRGTMIGPIVAALVAADVEQMVVDMVGHLSFDPDYQETFPAWKAAWDAAG